MCFFISLFALTPKIINIMNKKLLFFAVSALFFSTNHTFGQIVLTQETASDYLEKIAGYGIEWSNPVIVGSTDAIASYTGGASAGIGTTFNNTPTDFMDNGIVLSTGSLASSDAMEGPSSLFSSTDMGTSGFAELDALSGQQTYDGIGLEFDIVPATDELNIHFVFGSEEYNEWVNTDYNDVLGIFISGPGIPYPYPGKNIALAPNGMGVSSNHINWGNSDGCGYYSIGMYPVYYIDNCDGTYDNVMDGFTVMLTAHEFGLMQGETYYIRIVIADVIDAEYDSWLFIPANGIYSGEESSSNVISDKKSFTAYPNPVRDIFNVSYSTEITGVEVTNMLGQTLIHKTVNSTDVQIDMSDLPTGNYLVKVKTDEMIKVIKVVKQ